MFNLASLFSPIRITLYSHCILVVCIAGLAYCEVMWERPAVFKWMNSFHVVQAVYGLLPFLSFIFPCVLAYMSGGRMPIWRSISLVLVDFVLACLQFAILMMMAPIRY
jgi:hypothetical protein